MNTNNTNNVLPEIKTSGVFYSLITMILVLIVILFLVLFKVKIPFTKLAKSHEEFVSDILIVLFFSLLVGIICIILLPNFKDIKKLFEQISNVSYVIIYTIFMIIFFTTVSDNILNTYAYIILPLSALLGVFMFYEGSKTNYIKEFNINYERIKSMILLFCLITIFIIFYNTDPGGYIQKYFGFSLLLTIIVTVFAFLYLMIILTMTDSGKTSNLLEKISGFSIFGSISFLLFIIAVIIVIYTYPGGFFNDKTMSGFGMTLILIICILFSVLIGTTLFPENSNNNLINDKMNLFKKSLLILFGIVISGLIIFWIVYNIQQISGKSSTISFILNLLLVAIVLGLIYKIIFVKLPTSGNTKKNTFFTLIMNTIFYIPCLFGNAFDFIGKFFVGEYNSSSAGSLMMLVMSIVLFIVYFKTPSLLNTIYLQGGKLLVDKPVFTDKQHSLGTYQELNGTDNIEYQYAISFWVFLDAAAPNTNSSYTKYTPLLNFGGNPNILYNGRTNTLMVTVAQKGLSKIATNQLTEFDENDNRIIYKNDKMLLQKWNNIIVNYSGGVLDIFLNGELVKSAIGVVPYYTIENLTIGQDFGIKGGICNVVYFTKALTASNVYYLYNMVKKNSPPVLNESNKTLLNKI